MGRDGGDGGNIFEGVPEGPLPEELLTELLVAPGLRIARIVSTGQASPPGSWYDQELLLFTFYKSTSCQQK
jgi:cupin 2 domain-containing protein